MKDSANGNKKKTGVAILISDKIDFKTKPVIKNRKGHNDKRLNPARYNFIITYAHNIVAQKYVKEMSTDRKGEIDSNAVTVADFLTPHLHQWIEHSEHQ